ncbi:MAG TPA: phosphoribosylformylglycinamidine cyclo-ligase, partial [Cyanobacteria bacterium UBA8156]|nr:phosphoribosylformylglycinamidine cyclo-ligase [Cyanobacteria bacterium UBA8156]
DGVGTKLEVARALQKHDTIGIDLVAMCANDIATVGAEPLFFLDYLATGKLAPAALAEVVKGVADGCVQAGCALIGGETAEMPGFYEGDRYDVAGFCVGVVEKAELLDGSAVQVGDRVIGLASTGLHSNGYSLARRIVAGYAWDFIPPFADRPLGDLLLTPTAIYVQSLLAARRAGLPIHGLAHITGGGLPENLPRCLGEGQGVQIDRRGWEVPPLFRWLATVGDVDWEEMYRTFNMGIGMAVVVPPTAVKSTLSHFQAEQPVLLGEVVAGPRTLQFLD